MTMLEQRDICEQIHKVSKKHLSPNPKLLKNGTVSTLLANYRRLDDELQQKHGFQSLVLTNAEGFKRNVILRTSERLAPLIVFVTGTGLSVDMHALAEYMLPLCEAFPDWHFAVVENVTSGEWIGLNAEKGRLIVSGYEAGWDLYLVLQELRKVPALQGKVEKLNVLGLSLGGNDAAFCAYIDSILETQVIDGTIVACSSPLDRYDGLGYVRNLSGPLRPLMQFVFWRLYMKSRDVFQKYTDKTPFWMASRAVTTPMLLEEFYLRAAQDYFREHEHHFDPVGERPKILFEKPATFTLDHLSQIFHLDPYLPHIRHPFLWLNSKDDPIVPAINNQNALNRLTLSPSMEYIELPHGGHLGCTVAYSRDWLVHVVELALSNARHPSPHASLRTGSAAGI